MAGEGQSEVEKRLKEVSSGSFGFTEQEIEEAKKMGLDLNLEADRKTYNNITEAVHAAPPVGQIKPESKPQGGMGIKDMTHEKTSSY